MSTRASLPPAVPGAIREIESRAGSLAYYTNVEDAGARDAGADAPPLLLIHSINAAGSAYEVRPTYLHFQSSRPVYALDLPGFGRSERSERPYVPRLMTDAIHAIVDEIRARHGGARVDAMAVSLSCEFLARAANERAEAFRTLALVSPTGFASRGEREGAPGTNRGRPGVHRVIAASWLRGGLFGLLTRRGTIRYFLQRTYGSQQVDEGMVDYDWHTTHQPGAEHAPLYFLSGFLFSADVGPLYRALALPVWMSHGVRGDFVDYARKSELAGLPNWRFDVFDSGALPHFERAQEFHAKYAAFLTNADGR
jgi:pimeloyl-ACP methyl ester carboxylesterase